MEEQYEKLGLFYLGKHYDADKKSITDDLLLYDSKNLVTHGVCMGMTGSGKTGLCVSLLEEAAIDNVPSIIIDPKGDLTNLFLTFPELKGEQLEPWVSADEASQKGISTSEFATAQADLWKKGLAEWGQKPERIKMFADSVERRLYTPGSTAAEPISILKSFNKPEADLDDEVLAERISTLVSGLLGLLEIEADPLTSREHILLSNILQHEWSEGNDVDIANLIFLLQDPPISKIGVFDVEAYFPQKDRFELAIKLNNLLASPQFAVWTKGQPLNIDDLLYTKSGKPRMSVISIAHLSERERMFFVTLLLNELVSWMTRQGGTSSLRCLLYMDEVFGYLPPVANPPSKKMFLTLLKQARAFGLGLLLATQNPADLDYKALSNVGTWFIGRLQTEQDKNRVLDGLVSAKNGASKKDLSDQLAGLGKRIFMLNSAKSDHPFLFQTRWVLSYLAGPIMRNRFGELIKLVSGSGSSDNNETEATQSAASNTKSAANIKDARPLIVPEVEQIFVPGAGNAYQPMILASADVTYKDRKLGFSVDANCTRIVEIADSDDWSKSEILDFELDELEDDQRDGRRFLDIDESITKKDPKRWETDFKFWVYRSNPLTVFYCPSLETVSDEGEGEREFRIRISQTAREKRDELLDKIRSKYEKEIDRLEKSRQTAESKVKEQSAQAHTKTIGTAIKIGSSILGSLFGRGGISGVARSAQGIGSTMKERRDVDLAEQRVAEIDERLVTIEEDIMTELEKIQNPDTIEIQQVDINPNKADIYIKTISLAWLPVEISESAKA